MEIDAKAEVPSHAAAMAPWSPGPVAEVSQSKYLPDQPAANGRFAVKPMWQL